MAYYLYHTRFVIGDRARILDIFTCDEVPLDELIYLDLGTTFFFPQISGYVLVYTPEQMKNWKEYFPFSLIG